MKEKTFEVYLHMICVILLIIGGLNWGSIGLFNVNLVKLINQNTFNSELFESSIYITVGLASIYLAKNRNFYLPFLGNTVMPISVLKNISNPKANISLTVDAPNADMVMFWAAEPLTDGEIDGEKFAYEAYDKFSNAGIAEVIGGKATLKIACPQSYWVKKWGIKKTLPKHIHYRLVYPTGWVSEIKTESILC